MFLCTIRALRDWFELEAFFFFHFGGRDHVSGGFHFIFICIHLSAQKQRYVIYACEW